MDFKFSKHAIDAIQERKINLEWISLAIEVSDNVLLGEDENYHYIMFIPEKRNYLRVIVNKNVFPNVIVTVFFDRRLRRNYEDLS